MEKVLKMVIHYKDFLKLSDEAKHILLEKIRYIEFLISIKKEEYKKLSNEEKDKLRGFRRTEAEPFRKLPDKMYPSFEDTLFNNIPIIGSVIKMEQSFKEKHKKASKPYCQRTIGRPNTKNKGGR